MWALVVVAGMILALVVCFQLHAWAGVAFFGVVFCAGALKSQNKNDDA